ncbi:MAG TPA: UDP-4-amino-4,6-dideoxy-N-acetyl-beta-L-altrosamine transaminase, partial [Sphingomonadales bacterium]|nr:UDP-4-amino-4,6-dideoxy-N-acetyl-beta-L-altrosamine transaminase [Sphingomonadales bacterium]
DFGALGTTREDFVAALSARNIGTQVHYIPIYAHPYYQDKYGELSRPGAEEYYARTLSLPLHVSLSEDDVTYVIEQIADVL